MKRHDLHGRVFIVLAIALSFLYFATRLYRIAPNYLPMFTDEAIYTRWAQIGKYEANYRLTSLSDGKQPLFVWLTTAAMQYISNPLAAGRFVSIVAGAFTMLGLFLLSKSLFGNLWIGIGTSFLYCIYPFALILDRMAIYDSLVGTFSVWSLYVSLKLLRRLDLGSALSLALILGAGVLSKTSGFINIYLLPVTLLLFKPQKKQVLRSLTRWIVLVAIAVTLSSVYYSVLYLSPDVHMINQKNSLFVSHVSDVLAPGSVARVMKNMKDLLTWLVTYLSWPLAILAFSSLLFRREFMREKILLFLWFFLPFSASAMLGKILYPRYIFFMTLPLLPLVMYSLVKLINVLKNYRLSLALGAVCLSSVLFTDFRILTDFAHAPIPQIDSFQYMNGWPAGGGIRQILQFLKEQSVNGTIHVASEGAYGSLPTISVEMYLRDNANLKLQALPEIAQKIPVSLIKKARIMPVYVILNQTQITPQWPMDLVAQYQKGVGNWYIKIYKVRSTPVSVCDVSYEPPDQAPPPGDCTNSVH